MEAFFTRQRANEGIELPLALPDGTPTPHLIRIRGVDSDAYRQAEADSRRRLLEAAANQADKAKLSEMISSAIVELTAHLVVNWTFDTPCTYENVVKFLREAPQICDTIDRFAAKRSLFFKLGSLNSSPSPAQSSS